MLRSVVHQSLYTHIYINTELGAGLDGNVWRVVKSRAGNHEHRGR